MNSQSIDSPLRGKPLERYCWQDNEIYDIFQRIIGPFGTSLYATLSRQSFDDKVKYSLRSLASKTGQSRSAIDRNLKVLEHLGMVRLRFRGGNQESICELLNLKKLVQLWGGVADRQRKIDQLTDEVKKLRKKLKGTIPQTAGVTGNPEESTYNLTETLVLPDSERDAGFAPERRQRPTREMQSWFHLLLQETRLQENPTPTPSQIKEKATATADDSSGDDPAALLKLARDRFNGAINDLSDHLLSASTPSHPNLANGFNDWQRFGFRNLAVDSAAWRDNLLVLVLSADDPAAARRGLEKYHRKWNESLRKWFACEVTVDLREASGGHEPKSRLKG